MFGTSFNIETSDKQKAIKDQTTLPFMKMQGMRYSKVPDRRF